MKIVPSGTITATSTRSSRLSVRSSGERGWRKRAGLARRSAARSCPGRPRSRRTRPRPRRRTSPSGPRRPTARATGRDSPVRIDSSSLSPARLDERSVGDDLVARREPHEIAGHQLLDRPPCAPCRRGRPSHAARRGRRAGRARAWPAAPARSRWPAFATRIPRKSASRQSPNASVSTPKTSEDRR